MAEERPDRSRLLEVAHAHAEAEARGDMDATLATLEPDPVYELQPLGRALRGTEAVRRYYEHFFASFQPLVTSAELRSEWVNDEGLGQEYRVELRLPDGTPERHALIGILTFGRVALSGERIWGSDRALRLMFGPVLDLARPIRGARLAP